MKYSLIILILVMSVLVYADYNPTNDLDKPSNATVGYTGLQIAKSATSTYMKNWTIESIIKCLTADRNNNNYYTYQDSSRRAADHWDSNADAQIGEKLSKELNDYLTKFPACEKLLNYNLHAGDTATFDVYQGVGTGTDTETAGGMTCHRCVETGQPILDAGKALACTLYVGYVQNSGIEEVTIRTSKAIYKVYSADPIVLDLDGDGELEASKGNYLPHSLCIPESELVPFDINADGFDELVEWVGVNDGILVHDIVNNEVSGKNLFGDATGFKNGFEQLATLDTNKDGALTGEELAGLSVWQDKNRNAKIDAGEIHSLESLGITKLNVEAIELTATFERNGKYYKMWDWYPVTIMVKKTK